MRQTQTTKFFLFYCLPWKKQGPVSQAVTDSGFFPNSMAAYIKTGEQTGCLDEILDSLSGHYEQEQETSGQIRSAVTYPLLMLVMMGIVIIVLLVKVLPIFRQVFQQMGMEMNGFSSRLLNAGNIITRYSAFFSDSGSYPDRMHPVSLS